MIWCCSYSNDLNFHTIIMIVIVEVQKCSYNICSYVYNLSPKKFYVSSSNGSLVIVSKLKYFATATTLCFLHSTKILTNKSCQFFNSLLPNQISGL